MSNGAPEIGDNYKQSAIAVLNYLMESDGVNQLRENTQKLIKEYPNHAADIFGAFKAAAPSVASTHEAARSLIEGLQKHLLESGVNLGGKGRG